MRVKRKVFKNGIRVVASPSADTKSIAILIMVKTGSRNEESRINGISHFLEHMVFKGTERRPTAFDISKEIEGLGAQSNAYTAKEYTIFFIKTISNHFEEAVDILADILLNPSLDEDEINRERNVILEEKKMYEDNPRLFIDDLFEQAFFDDERLSQDIIGTEKAIKEMTRDDFLSFRSKYYKSENIVVSIAGDIPKGYIKILEKYLEGVKRGKETLWLSKRKKPLGIKSLYKDIFQANLIVGFPGTSYGDRDYITLKVLSEILGGGASSRLFQEIREKRGLAYNVYSGIGAYSDKGYLEIGLGTDVKNFEKALEIIKKEIKNFSLLKEDDLRIAKERLKGIISFEFENSLKRAEFYAKRELYHKNLDSLDQIIKDIERVRLKELKELALNVFSKKPTLAVIGPFKNTEKFANLLSS